MREPFTISAYGCRVPHAEATTPTRARSATRPTKERFTVPRRLQTALRPEPAHEVAQRGRGRSRFPEAAGAPAERDPPCRRPACRGAGGECGDSWGAPAEPGEPCPWRR